MARTEGSKDKKKRKVYSNGLMRPKKIDWKPGDGKAPWHDSIYKKRELDD